ncbi:MAG: hypothetical protein AAFQ43_05055 [Bacteroidota bacterium]
MDFDRMDKTAFSIVYSHEEAAEADRQFWWSQTPSDRIRTVENLRRRCYGDRLNPGLQRVLEVARRELR